MKNRLAGFPVRVAVSAQWNREVVTREPSHAYGLDEETKTERALAYAGPYVYTVYIKESGGSIEPVNRQRKGGRRDERETSETEAFPVSPCRDSRDSLIADGISLCKRTRRIVREDSRRTRTTENRQGKSVSL